MGKSTTSSSKRWQQLLSGDVVRVQSHSGTTYEATVIHAGRDQAGLYVRLSNGRLARLLPSRVNWRTLEKLGAANPIAKGDEIIVVALGGTERRGRLVMPLDDRVAVSLPQGKTYSVPLDQTETKKFRLLFPTETLLPGDEFMVKSRSGKEYRGLALEVDPLQVVALLRPSKERVTLRRENLDPTTLFVMIPVLGSSATWDTRP